MAAILIAQQGRQGAAVRVLASPGCGEVVGLRFVAQLQASVAGVGAGVTHFETVVAFELKRVAKAGKHAQSNLIAAGGKSGEQISVIGEHTREGQRSIFELVACKLNINHG